MATSPHETLGLDQQLCFALHAATRAMTCAYRPLLDDLGVTYPQYLVLLVLWETDGLCVSRIGERLYLDSATLTPLLKRLEAQGLVERTRSKADERLVEVRLTPEGQRLRRQATGVPKGIAQKAGLGLAEAVALRRTLARLTKTLKEG